MYHPNRSACPTPSPAIHVAVSSAWGGNVLYSKAPGHRSSCGPDCSPSWLRCDARMGSLSAGPTPGGMKRVEGFRPTAPKAWETMSAALRRAKVKALQPQQVASGSSWNKVLVDVRPRDEYQEAHVKGSLNVPIYQPIAGWSPQQIARRAGYAFFGVAKGTEANPNFMEEFKSAVGPKWKEVVIICETGGTLESTGNFPNGKQSRSLIACYEALLEGYSRVCFLEGGMNSYFKASLPLEDETPEKKSPFIF